MSTQDYILIEHFCTHHNIPVSLRGAFHYYELKESTTGESASSKKRPP